MQTMIEPREQYPPTAPSTRALLNDALAAFREGRRAVSTPPNPTATDALLREQMLGRLRSADRRGLETVAAPREHALALARAGTHAEAGASMSLARFLLSLTRFSDEGRQYAETLHHAAESYLSFRRGDHAQAKHQMVRAIDVTERLAGMWGESEFIVCRRVHLAHNLMRVEAAMGESTEALRRGVRLLEYISVMWADASADRGAPPLSRIGAGIAEVYFDLVAQTLAELFVTLAPHEVRVVLASLDELDVPPTWRGREWLTVKEAAAGTDSRRFVAAATPFLRVGRSSAPTLWWAVAFDLLPACGAFGIPAAALAAEIRSELNTGQRVPACLRVGAAPN